VNESLKVIEVYSQIKEDIEKACRECLNQPVFPSCIAIQCQVESILNQAFKKQDASEDISVTATSNEENPKTVALTFYPHTERGWGMMRDLGFYVPVPEQIVLDLTISTDKKGELVIEKGV
jgi:hypothetical protein